VRKKIFAVRLSDAGDLQCLKESYVKSFGIGIGLSLERLECHIRSPVSESTVVSDTEMWVDGDVDSSASFEESLLDDKHLVVVCLKQVLGEYIKLDSGNVDYF